MTIFLIFGACIGAVLLLSGGNLAVAGIAALWLLWVFFVSGVQAWMDKGVTKERARWRYEAWDECRRESRQRDEDERRR